jgi:hypothetical protein
MNEKTLPGLPLMGDAEARSMSSRKGNKISGQFSGHLIEMLESPAWRVLSQSALRLLFRVEIEHARHGGKDNGALPVSYDDFEAYGIDRHAIAPAMREVVALGFLEITEAGRAGNAAWRKPNLFRLTYRHVKGAHGDGTHEWRKIATIEQASLIAKAARSAKNPSKAQAHSWSPEAIRRSKVSGWKRANGGITAGSS